MDDAPRCRPFRLGDAMALVAAFGLALAWATWMFDLLGTSLDAIPRVYGGMSDWRDWTPGRWEHALVLAMLAASTAERFLACGLLFYLIARLRRPRPTLRELAVQPGLAGLAGSALVLAVGAGLMLVPWPPGVRIWVGAGALIALVLAAPLAWAALGLAGRWRPEPGWIERLGRGLWVALASTLAVHAAAAIGLTIAP